MRTWKQQLDSEIFDGGRRIARLCSSDWSLCPIGEGLNLNNEKNWNQVTDEANGNDTFSDRLQHKHEILFHYGCDFAKFMSEWNIKQARETAKLIRNYIRQNGGPDKIREDLADCTLPVVVQEANRIIAGKKRK